MSSYPGGFYLMLIIVPVILLLWRNFTGGRDQLKVLGGKWRFERLYNIFLVKWFFSTLMFLLFIVFCVISLTGIQGGAFPETDDSKGLDIVFAIDTSRSMLANDIEPNRLSKTKGIIKGLMESFTGNRFSLVAFKGEAITLVPLTEDTDYLLKSLDFLNVNTITTPGTNLEAGIEEAYGNFPIKTSNRRIILLFSDGDTLSGSAERLIAREQRNIPIFTIGTGTGEGSTIPLGNDRYVTDVNGSIVTTVLQAEELVSIAEMTEGEFYELPDNRLLSLLGDDLRQLAGYDRGKGFIIKTVDQFRNYLIPALVFLLGCVIIRVIRWKS